MRCAPSRGVYETTFAELSKMGDVGRVDEFVGWVGWSTAMDTETEFYGRFAL